MLGNNKYQKVVAPTKYEDALKEAALDRKAEQVSSRIKKSVRRTIDGMCAGCQTNQIMH